MFQNMAPDTYFNGTCEAFAKQDCAKISELIMDPCNCYYYYQCAPNQVIHKQCSPGTAFNYLKVECEHENMVFQRQECGGNENPWERCKNATDERKKQLADICSKTTTTIKAAFTVSTPAAGIRSAPATGINPGILIGAIIAGAVFTAIIFLAIVMYRRRQKPTLSTSPRSLSNDPDYREAENPEDPYSVINDTHIVNNPTYTETQNTHGPTTSNGIHHQYGALSDNSGAREVNVYHTLNLSSDGYEIPRTSVADSSTRTSDLYSKPHKKIGNPDTEGNIGFALGVDSPPVRKEMSDGSGGNHETHPVYFEPQPDYFVLEKVDHFCDQNQ